MTAEHDLFRRAMEIAGEALALDPGARARLVEERCGADAPLRREVDALVAALDAGEGALAPGRGLELVAGADPARKANVETSLPKLRGDYRILRVIGEGGMGVVYEAEQAVPRRNVALKAVRPGFVSRAMLERLEREAHILGRLHHPCIAQIFEAGTDLPERGLQAFIAMELVDGPPITEWAAARDVRSRVEILARVCDAVQHAHERRVIHRDLKPSNILVDPSGQPKVLDFGVARVFDAEVLDGALRTNAGMLVGTLAYMSPEQVGGDPDEIDTRTDVYALGVILFELLTGRLPHPTQRRTLPQMVLAIRDEPVPRLASIDARLGGDLDAIAAKALEKDRDRRYASAAELAHDLRRHLRAEPILARADSGFYVLGRQIRKHRLLATTTAVAVIALAAAAVEYGLRARREAGLRTEAVALGQRLDRALRESDVERARLMGLTGNLSGAEAILWRAQIAAPDEGTRWALWELYSRHPCLRSFGEVGDTTFALCAGRTPDEVIVSSHDGSIRVCDVEHGAVRALVPGRGVAVTVLACDVARGRVWAGAEDGSLRAFDLGNGAELERLDACPGGVWCLACTSDFGRAALSCGEGRVRIVDLARLEVVRELEGHVGGTRGIAFGPDGRLWTGGQDAHVRIWDVESGAQVGDVMTLARPVTSLVFAPGSSQIGVACADGTLTLLDAADARRIVRFDAGAGAVRSITCSDDGRSWIVAGDARTTVWDVDAEPRREATIEQRCSTARFCGDGSTIVTSASSGPIRAWSRAPLSFLSTYFATLAAGMPSALARGGRIAATSDAAGALAFTELPSGRALGRTASSIGKPSCFALDARGARAATGERDGLVRAFESPSGRELWSQETGPLAIKSLSYGDDGRALLCGKNGGALIVLYAATGTERARIDTGLDDVDSAILDARARRIFATHRGRVVSGWDVATRAPILRFDAPSAVAELRLLAGDQKLAVATWAGPVEVWDLATGTRTSLIGHAQRVRCIRQAPDAELLVTGDDDGDLRLWDIATGAPLTTFSAGAGPIRDIAFPSEGVVGRTLYSVHDDGVVRAWDLGLYDACVRDNQEYWRRAAAKPAEY